MRIKIQFFKMGKTASCLSADSTDPEERKEMMMLKRRELLEDWPWVDKSRQKLLHNWTISWRLKQGEFIYYYQEKKLN